MYGSVLYQAFRELKRTFDPHNLLNPGKIVDAPPLSTNLRYGPGYVTPAVRDHVRLHRRRRPAAGRRAVRRRRGLPEEARGDDVPLVPGDPRREGQHARPRQPAPAGDHRPARLSKDSPTRASTKCSTSASNARPARASAPPTSTWPGSRPSSCISIIGSMAYPGATGSSAMWPSWAGSDAALAPVSNWLAQSGLTRWLNEKFLGIDRRRMPPAFARRSLDAAVSAGLALGMRWTIRSAHGPPVLLFPDTFTNYFEPEIGEAAIELLQRAGCAVTLGPPGLRCCGRPMISNGLLDEAVANARHNVERLHDWSQPGWTDHRLRAELHPDDQGRLSRTAQGRAACARPRRSPRPA